MMKDVSLFTSNFARFNFPLMDIEVMGNLKIKKADIWLPVIVQDYTVLQIDDFLFKIPTIKEQIRILSLFGREKDRLRISQIDSFLRQELKKE